MEQLKLFVTGKTLMANTVALLISIGVAATFQYRCQKNEEMLTVEPNEKPKLCMKKYIMWGIVVVFLIPLIIGAMPTSTRVKLSSSFEAGVYNITNQLHTTSENDFKARVGK